MPAWANSWCLTASFVMAFPRRSVSVGREERDGLGWGHSPAWARGEERGGGGYICYTFHFHFPRALPPSTCRVVRNKEAKWKSFRGWAIV